jgi:hypothetical protein
LLCGGTIEMRNAKRIDGSKWAVLCLVVGVLWCPAQAQSQSERRWEAGVQGVVTDFEGLGEVPGGLGVRCLYNLNENLAFDGEVDYFPNSKRRGRSPFPGIRSEITSPHGETEALLGLKMGLRWGGFGLFAKARPGIVRLTDYQTRWLTDPQKTRAALDLGGILELYPASRLVIRFDLGGLFVPLGDRYVSPVAPAPTVPVEAWNLQGGVGLAVRF